MNILIHHQFSQRKLRGREFGLQKQKSKSESIRNTTSASTTPRRIGRRQVADAGGVRIPAPVPSARPVPHQGGSLAAAKPLGRAARWPRPGEPLGARAASGPARHACPASQSALRPRAAGLGHSSARTARLPGPPGGGPTGSVSGPGPRSERTCCLVQPEPESGARGAGCARQVAVSSKRYF